MTSENEIFKYLLLPGKEIYHISDTDKKYLGMKLMFGGCKQLDANQLLTSLHYNGLIYTGLYRNAVKETIGRLYIRQMLYN